MKSFIFAVLFALNFQVAFARAKEQVIELKVTEEGFKPSSVDVKPGLPVVLKITRTTDSTCATQIKIPSKNLEQDLPLNKSVTISLGQLENGQIRFGCGMDMISGNIFIR